ncbi:uncharacterized protein RSE6_05872 [Rhynchosporium secalis]|uniref:Uncharacterized protein n=1 Tax=Rhynchosporium secalis TaxID=38038 RepID=A0A1E1MA42_RHYSE|nr:uncharacterized protein RSE6_05872 [Rhynchosporium secalis]
MSSLQSLLSSAPISTAHLPPNAGILMLPKKTCGARSRVLPTPGQARHRAHSRFQKDLSKETHNSLCIRPATKTKYDAFADPKPKSEALQTVILSCGRHSELVPCGRRFPPLKKLKLFVYKWVTSVEDFSSMWDFSELRCLSMMSSNFCNFMSSVPIDSLTELRTFYLNATFHDFLDAHDADDEDCRTATAQKFLVSLLESCKHLESLKIESNQWQEILPISSIAKLGTRLRKLRLRSDRSEASLVPKQFLLDTPDLCPDIVDLDLELDVASPSVSYPHVIVSFSDTFSLLVILQLYGYLSVLTRSKSLSDINPWLQGSTTIDDEVGKQSTDPNYDGAASIMRFLYTHKCGKPFNMVRTRLFGAKQPANWRPTPEYIEMHGGEEWSSRRDFKSRINVRDA